jgi:hypothetical protein
MAVIDWLQKNLVDVNMNKLGKKTDYSSCGFYYKINGVSTDPGQKQNGIPT